jgi:hypothetical protein
LHLFGLGAELVSARPGQRLPDLALSLFLSLGGHLERPCDKILINPLPGYVENKAAFAESRFQSAVTFDNASL